MKDEISPQEILEEVSFTIDKDAFKGPFTCCNTTTKKVTKKLSYKGFELVYEIWQCKKCNKEYVDKDQAKKLETFWVLERLINDKLVTMARTINFDGKTHFIRFPKELSKNWGKGQQVDIKLLTPERFLVEVKA
ncbi:MAG: hypothetical protein AABX70_04880 [Nanoarchaeota archaeon]